jgi:hypothetical protein
LPASEDTRAPTDPLIADQRNDAHAIISQLTVLFHDLHNRIVGALRAPGTRPDERDARARFLCARAAVAAIYRRIVRDDLLPRLVLPAVDAAFRARACASRTPPARCRSSSRTARSASATPWCAKAM